jgi:hypothetical protein
VAKGVLGIGTSRLSIEKTDAPLDGGLNLTTAQQNLALTKTYWVNSADGVRPRQPWVNFPNWSTDSRDLPAAGGGAFLTVYCATGDLDGGRVFVAAGPGTVSGSRVQVFYDGTVLVETFDNLPDAQTAATTINRTSTYLYVKPGGGTAATFPATQIGNARRNGIIQVVDTLYPLGVHHYEGPINEPNLNDVVEVHHMRLFQGAVHAGHPDARAIGPCPVAIDTGSWEKFLAAGGGQWCDEFAFHAYNADTAGNVAQGRTSLAAFTEVLARYGQEHKPRWQTESGMAFTAVYSVYHPHRSYVKIIDTLLLEQFGIPFERNTPWYDPSHGFWDHPAWWINGDSSLEPVAAMLHTLVAETWRRTFTTALDFGPWGNSFLVGNVYTGTDGATAALCAQTDIPGFTVTLAVPGAPGDLVTVDAWGNTGTVPVLGGLVTLPVGAQPVFLRLPAGVTANVHALSDWPALSAGGATPNSARGVRPVERPTDRRLTDERWMTFYNGDYSAECYFGPAALPDTLTLRWDTPTRFDRLLLMGPPAWQQASTLLDFDVQTSDDGQAWTTRLTVTKTGATTFRHATGDDNTGCTVETFWDEQSVHDLRLPAPVTARFLRLYVRAASCGGEPNQEALDTGGQGGLPRIVLQELAVFCDDNLQPHYAVLPR